jgi:hypothetical protein
MKAIDSYVCPVCRYPGAYTYLRCDHPGCPDGRDIGLREQADQRDQETLAKRND